MSWLAVQCTYTKVNTLKAFLQMYLTKASSVNTFTYFVVHKGCSMSLININNVSFNDNLEA